MEIKELAKEINQLANKNGFWDEIETINNLTVCQPDKINLTNAIISQKLMLIVSELSEAMETLRKNGLQIKNEFVKDSFSDELSDAVIRIFDLAEQLGIDIEKCIKWKHEYNKNRPYKHGKQF